MLGMYLCLYMIDMDDILLIDKYWLAITLKDDRLKVNKNTLNQSKVHNWVQLNAKSVFLKENALFISQNCNF